MRKIVLFVPVFLIILTFVLSSSVLAICSYPTIYDCDTREELSQVIMEWINGTCTYEEVLECASHWVGPIPCGETITQDYILTNDLINCSGYGLIIEADNIFLDCKGHTISGDGFGYDYGIYILGKNNVSIKNCNVKGFYRGIFLDYDSSHNNLINNTVNYNDYVGIQLYYSSFNTFIGNIANYNDYGIDLYSSSYNTFTDNEFIENNIYGAYLRIDSQYNTFHSNNFTNNNISAYEDANSNNNNWNTTIGNYWSDFASNPGYPNYYEIPGSGNGVDWHPIVPVSITFMNIVLNANGNVEITWESIEGVYYDYDVEYADGLYDEASLVWTAVTGIPGQAGTTTWEDVNTPSTSGRYYKVRISNTSFYTTDTVGIYWTSLRNSIYSGMNYVATPFVPFNNSLDAVLGDQLPGSTVRTFATNCWKWNQATLSYERAFLYDDGITKEWRDFYNPANPPTFTFDADVGYRILLTPLATEITPLYFVGKVSPSDRNITLARTIYSGLNYAASAYPVNVPLQNSGLLESGFVGAPSFYFADQLWFWDWETRSYDRVYYDTVYHKWLTKDGTPTTRELRPGEGFRIVLSPISELTNWTYPKPYTHPPNN